MICRFFKKLHKKSAAGIKTSDVIHQSLPYQKPIQAGVNAFILAFCVPKWYNAEGWEGFFMKKKIAIICILSVLTLSACGKSETAQGAPGGAASENASETLRQGEMPGDEASQKPEAGLEQVEFSIFEPAISVRYATDDEVSFPEGKAEDEVAIVFSADETVTNLKTFNIAPDPSNTRTMSYIISDIGDGPESFTPSDKFIMAATFAGMIPNNGVSYTDERGKTRYFSINISGEDGALFLLEFYPN